MLGTLLHITLHNLVACGPQRATQAMLHVVTLLCVYVCVLPGDPMGDRSRHRHQQECVGQANTLEDP